MTTLDRATALDLFTRNQPLAFHVAWRYRSKAAAYGVDLEDVQQAALLGLWEGVQRHDPARGAVSTVAWWWIRSRIARLFGKPQSVETVTAQVGDWSGPDGVLDALGSDGNHEETAGRRLDVAEALGRLRARDRQLLTLRFGLDGGGERTLEQLAEALDLTRERCRQLLDGALVRLYRVMRRK